VLRHERENVFIICVLKCRCRVKWPGVCSRAFVHVSDRKHIAGQM